MAKMINEQETPKMKHKLLLDGVDEKGESLGFAPIKESNRRVVTAQLIENTINEAQTNTTSGIDNVDPVLINMVRRLAPNLIAYDIVGVQAMKNPASQIFALRAHYGAQPVAPLGRPGDGRTGFLAGDSLNTAGYTTAEQWGVDGVATAEAFYNEVDTGATTGGGLGTQTSNASAPNYSSYSVGTGMTAAQLEALTTGTFKEMSISIQKTTVEAKGRALKASWTRELQQDLMAVHGLDAEAELSNILSTELTSEINREVINRIRFTAKIAVGEKQYASGVLVTDSAGDAVLGTTGEFDLEVNSDGRWSNEKHKSLLVKINKEANKIAKQTRRGKANFLICSSDVASILDLTGKMVYAPAIDNNLVVDDTGNTFVGVLQGQYKVFIDPFLGYDEIILGYKGNLSYDAGLFYCPYVPLEKMTAQDPANLQPVMAFKTRYGLVANPFTTMERNSNLYYTKFKVLNL